MSSHGLQELSSGKDSRRWADAHFFFGKTFLENVFAAV
jgi:hypothetical protein